MLVNNVPVTRGFDASSVSGRARSSHGTARLRSAVGALKLRGPFQSERSGSGSYSLGGERVYDPSASLRAGSGPAHGSADSRQRYCANLGHRQDDETGTYTGGSPDGDGLVYMRARYYEPGTGRFVSEDPAKQGKNWYSYCSNNPIGKVDHDGRTETLDDLIYGIGFLLHKLGFAMFLTGMTCIGLGVTSATISSILIPLGVAMPFFVANAGLAIAGGAIVASLGVYFMFMGDMYMALGSDADDFFKEWLDPETALSKMIDGFLGKKK